MTDLDKLQALADEITTSTGTTVKFHTSEDNRLVILDNPNAPDDMRDLEAGRIIHGGFQPAFMSAFALTPGVLRAIADHIEKEVTK